MTTTNRDDDELGTAWRAACDRVDEIRQEYKEVAAKYPEVVEAQEACDKLRDELFGRIARPKSVRGRLAWRVSEALDELAFLILRLGH